MRQIMPIAGAVVGSFFPGMGTQLGYAIGSLIGGIVDPIEIQGRKLGDAPTQVAAEGGARAVVFGKGCVRAVVLMERGGRTVKKQRARGGKGGPKQEGDERAYWTYAIGIGEAIPDGGLLRIWENEKLVYDVTPTSQIVEDSTEFAKLFRFYDGAEDQLPDPAIEAIYTDPTDAPYYRGTAYMVFPQRDLTDFGEAVPTYRVEVAAAAEVNTHVNGWNPTETEPGLVYSNSNKTATTVPALRRGAQCDSFRGAGKWYAEVLINAIGPSTGGTDVGVATAVFNGLSEVGSTDGGGCSVLFDGRKYRAGTPSGHFDEPPADGDVINFAFSDGSLWIGLNGDYMGGNPAAGSWPAFTGLSGEFAPAFSGGGGAGAQVTVRLKDEDFTGPKPSGFAQWFDSGSSEASQVQLAYVVASLHNRCGHEATDYDVTALSDMIDGVVIESTQTGAEAINSLIGTHWADPADYDGKIRYIKRGAAVVRTLTIDDLIDEPETWQRNNAIEYPAKMHFFGQIADLAYASVKATSARYSADAKVVGEASVSSPETFNDSQRPYEIAAILHKILWTEANGEVTWRVTDEHIDLVPTDCVGLSWAGQLWRARIVQIEADPGELKLKMKLDRQSAYTANLTAIPIPPAPTPPQTGIVSDTVLAIMDLPALTDNADTLHYYAAMCGKTDSWAGAQLQQSLDEGATFTAVGESSLNSIIGTLGNSIQAGGEWYTDTFNEVVVTLYTSDTLESISDDEFLRGGGAFALSYKMDGWEHPQWEVMQFRDAEQIGEKTWKLTTLHRGQKGTIPVPHKAGDTFVLLDSSILRLPAQTSWIWRYEDFDRSLLHRAVSYGRTSDTADEVESIFFGNSQLEFPTASIIARRDGGMVYARAIVRHRFGTPMGPIRSVNFEGYRWTVSSGPPSFTEYATIDTGIESDSIEIPDTFPLGIQVSCVLRNRILGLGRFERTVFPGEPGFSYVRLD